MTFKDQYGIDLPEALAALDQSVVIEERGRVVSCVGFRAGFYVFPNERPDVRERFISAYEKYRDGAGDKLVWGADPKTGTPKKLVGTSIGDVRSWARRLGPQEGFGFIFHGGKHKDDANPFSVRAYTTTEYPHLSRITFTWSMGWVAEHTLATWQKHVIELASIIGPAHGYAGWSAVLHVINPSVAAWRSARMLASRFHGLEVDDPVRHSVDLEKVDAIKGVNWLTILGQPFVDRLGGPAQLAAALGPANPLLPFDGGLVVQAGPRALLGDVNQGERLEHYREVAKVLKPIRAQKMKYFDLVEFNQEATDAWRTRFDDP